MYPVFRPYTPQEAFVSNFFYKTNTNTLTPTCGVHSRPAPHGWAKNRPILLIRFANNLKRIPFLPQEKRNDP